MIFFCRSAERYAVGVGGFEDGRGQFGQHPAVRRCRCSAYPRRTLEQSRKSRPGRGPQHRRNGRRRHLDAGQEGDGREEPHRRQHQTDPPPIRRNITGNYKERELIFFCFFIKVNANSNNR